MNINKFAKIIAEKEEGKEEVSIAQIKEILRIVKEELHKEGVNLYKLIYRRPE